MLARQGLLQGRWCLLEKEKLSPNQLAEIGLRAVFRLSRIYMIVVEREPSQMVQRVRGECNEIHCLKGAKKSILLSRQSRRLNLLIY